MKDILVWTECLLTKWEGSRLDRGTSQTTMQTLQSLLPPARNTEVSIHHLSPALSGNGLTLFPHVMHWMQAAPERAWPGRGRCVPLRLTLKELAAGGCLLTTIHTAGLHVGFFCLFVLFCFLILFIYLFIFGCVGSLFLCEGFL